MNLKRWNYLHWKSHFTFTTYLSINKQDPKEYDVIYLDECHSLLESHKEFLDEF